MALEEELAALDAAHNRDGKSGRVRTNGADPQVEAIMDEIIAEATGNQPASNGAKRAKSKKTASQNGNAAAKAETKHVERAKQTSSGRRGERDQRGGEHAKGLIPRPSTAGARCASCRSAVWARSAAT